MIAPHPFPLTIYCIQTLLSLRLWLFRGIGFRGIELAKRANDRDVVPGGRRSTSWGLQKFTGTVLHDLHL